MNIYLILNTLYFLDSPNYNQITAYSTYPYFKNDIQFSIKYRWSIKNKFKIFCEGKELSSLNFCSTGWVTSVKIYLILYLFGNAVRSLASLSSLFREILGVRVLCFLPGWLIFVFFWEIYLSVVSICDVLSFWRLVLKLCLENYCLCRLNFLSSFLEYSQNAFFHAW